MGANRVFRAFTPYNSGDLLEIDYAQNADVIYLAHFYYPLTKLTRSSHTDWTLASVTFGPPIDPPTGVGAAPTQPNTTGAIPTTYVYSVTSVNADGKESRASSSASATNDLSLQGNFNTVTLTAEPDASSYVVYRGDNGAPGYVGNTTGLTFKDRNLIAILSDTPPEGQNPFAAPGDYPSTVEFHQQRLMTGRTINRPNAIYGSKSADFENMDVSRPAKPDDALAFALVANMVNPVNQLVSMKRELVALTADNIFTITGADGGAMTPASIEPKRENGRGASRLNPIVVDSVIFYQPAKSSEPRALGFTFESDGYRTNNIAIFSPHFFKRHRIVSWAYQEEPYSVIWAARDDGILLCFTWEEEQQVWGWTLCETDGYVEQVATITEQGYDRLYALVRRTINGVEHRFHERMALPHFDDVSVACHLDCAVTQVYETATDVVDGLWHLEGATVSAHYDGYAVHNLTVADGRVTLPHEANVITVGLRFYGLIETLPLALAGAGGSLHVERQNIGQVTVRAIDTKGLVVGATGATLDPLPERDGPSPYDLPEIEARDYTISVEGSWQDSITLTIEQNEPFPAYITALFVELLVSDTNVNAP